MSALECTPTRRFSPTHLKTRSRRAIFGFVDRTSALTSRTAAYSFGRGDVKPKARFTGNPTDRMRNMAGTIGCLLEFRCFCVGRFFSNYYNYQRPSRASGPSRSLETGLDNPDPVPVFERFLWASEVVAKRSVFK